jgi:hypothetical protein
MTETLNALSDEEIANIKARLYRPMSSPKTVFRIIAETDIATLLTEVERLKVEHTRAILHYTVKGYTAGENTDAKHWRERAEKAEAQLAARPAVEPREEPTHE